MKRTPEQVLEVYGVWELWGGNGTMIAAMRVQATDPPTDPPPGCWSFDGRRIRFNLSDLKARKRFRVITTERGRAQYTREVIIEGTPSGEPSIHPARYLHSTP